MLSRCMLNCVRFHTLSTVTVQLFLLNNFEILCKLEKVKYGETSRMITNLTGGGSMLDFGGWNLIYIGISAVISLGIVSYYLVGWIRKSNNIGAESNVQKKEKESMNTGKGLQLALV